MIHAGSYAAIYVNELPARSGQANWSLLLNSQRFAASVYAAVNRNRRICKLSPEVFSWPRFIAVSSSSPPRPEQPEGSAGFFVHRHFRRFPRGANPSYSQSGEDVIATMIFGYLGIASNRRISTSEPGSLRRGNNTYLFYSRGSRGVLVEPNVAMIPELKARTARR